MRIKLFHFCFIFILFFDCCTNADTTGKDKVLQDSVIMDQNEQLLIIKNDSLPITPPPYIKTKQDSLLEAREDSLS